MLDSALSVIIKTANDGIFFVYVCVSSLQRPGEAVDSGGRAMGARVAQNLSLALLPVCIYVTTFENLKENC